MSRRCGKVGTFEFTRHGGDDGCPGLSLFHLAFYYNYRLLRKRRITNAGGGIDTGFSKIVGWLVGWLVGKGGWWGMSFEELLLLHVAWCYGMLLLFFSFFLFLFSFFVSCCCCSSTLTLDLRHSSHHLHSVSVRPRLSSETSLPLPLLLSLFVFYACDYIFCSFAVRQ